MGNSLESLPVNITSSRSLKDFNAADNRLRTLPDGWGSMAALVSLTLYGNQIEELPEDLASAPRLRTLWLEGNPISVRHCHLLHDLLAAKRPPPTKSCLCGSQHYAD
jgi:Leucine-rich repeat (LRR) protein